jgi:deoxyribonuclease (pyrimidine dimer)
MTRINVIPPDQLTDNFLRAEIFELPRLFPLVCKAAGKGNTVVPNTYRLGEGHMRFFYNKLTFLFKRFNALRNEAHKRGIPIVTDPAVDPAYLAPQHYGPEIPSWYWQDYEPTAEAIQLNLDRLAVRRKYDGGVYD